MKCPRCGNEMTLDTHRKIPLEMCYSCGYIEGRTVEECADDHHVTNFEHMKTLNLNEMASFLAPAVGMSAEEIAEWLGKTADEALD